MSALAAQNCFAHANSHCHGTLSQTPKCHADHVCCGDVQILGNNECFEPYTSNIYVRRVLSGEFTVVNQHLLMDLTRLGLWSPDLKNELVAANGSIQVCSLPMLHTGLLFAHAPCRFATCPRCVNSSSFGMHLAHHELESLFITIYYHCYYHYYYYYYYQASACCCYVQQQC